MNGMVRRASFDGPAKERASPTTARWGQLAIGLVCMMTISSPQYVWTLFAKPIAGSLQVSNASIQVTFSLLVVIQTFLAPFQGWMIQFLGARWLLGVGTVITGMSWILAGQAESLTEIYISYGMLGGLGTGIVYIGVVGHMLAWFPDRRGFAVGMVAAGYGMGALLTTFPISHSLVNVGWETTLTWFGAALGLVGLAAASGLRPSPATAPYQQDGSTGATTITMLRTKLFWLMFAMMAMMSTSGLMVTSQMGLFAGDFGVDKALVFGMAALPLALTIDRVCNGLTRPFFGFVSDWIGRENTMAVAFALEGVAMTVWVVTRGDPVLFVLLSGLVFFGWGEIFSLFPATLTDSFGNRHATRNYGCLYMAQGIGSILGGPLASLLHQQAGSWTPVFAVAIAADLLTAALALVVLKRLRRIHRFAAKTNELRQSRF